MYPQLMISHHLMLWLKRFLHQLVHISGFIESVIHEKITNQLGWFLDDGKHMFYFAA